MIGRMLAFTTAGALKGWMGCAGVPKAGEDDGIGFAGVAICLKNGAALDPPWLLC